MRARAKPIVWRFTVYLMIFVLIFSSQASATAKAAPPDALPKAPPSPSAPGDHLVTNLSFSRAGPNGNVSEDTPNILRDNEDLIINFNYSTTDPGGVLIYIRPFSNGALSPSYAACPSPLYPQSATGTGACSLTITTGVVLVDQLRIQMYNANQSTLLFEAFVPVYYLFSDASSLVYDFAIAPDTPNALKFNENVNLTFNYITRNVGGVRIFPRPFTNGALTPNYGASGSPLYPTGGGSGSGFFTITSTQVVVDQIRIQMLNDAQTVLLFEAFLPVYFRFRDGTNIVNDISLVPDTPNIFKYGSNVLVNFNYTTNEPNGVRIFARPFSGANLSPNYAAFGSNIYPVGSGSGQNGFTLSAGPLSVDKIRIQMWNSNQTKLLFEAFLPVYLLWAGAGPPPGPDMHLDAIEVTQAIQDLNNSVDLVAGKKTYVRVHAASPVNTTHVFATLTGKHGFVNLAPTLTPGNPGGDITVRTAPDRGQINDSYWYELPSGWTSAGSLTLVAKLDPNNAKNDLNQANNTASVTVNFLETPPLRLRIMDVQYTSGGTTYLAASTHMDKLESWLRRAYPINTLQVTRQTFIYPSAGLPNVDTLHGYLALTKIFRIIFNGEDPRIVYYGMVDDGGGFMRGKALGIPSTIAAGPTGTDNWGWDYDGSYGDWYGGHEIGHTRGRYHAEFCGATGGAPYPYTGGRISPSLSGNTAIYGFDITTHAIYPPSWEDVMTYCSNEWVSDFTYEGIRNYLVGTGGAFKLASVSADQFLAVVGSADLNVNTAHLESVYLINQANTIDLPLPGSWDIVLVDGSNVDLATFPFAPSEVTDNEGGPAHQGVIAEVVPWTPGTARVDIRFNGTTVASRTASAHAPTVTLNTPADGTSIPAGPFQVTWTGNDADGDPLNYSLLYSHDGGTTWDTLAANLTGSSQSLNTNQIPGGSGLLRVVATDGFLSGQDTGGTITVPLHAPSVQILSPSQNQQFFPTQDVILQGTAYDLEDGTPSDAAFSWSSDLDGALGTGATLDTSVLSTGTHVITLQVIDSNGMTGQAQRTITISPEDAPVPINLNVAPFEVGESAAFLAPSFTDTLTLRSSSATEVSWTASENIPWLSLDTTSGQTPNDLVMTFDPSQLSVGNHSGVITFSSGQAGNAPFQVTVNLMISGRAVFLPIMRK